jgi:putative flippase GtrA
LYRYSVSGVTSFILELLLLTLLLLALSLPYYVAVPLGFAVATTAQWLICHWWVFTRSGRRVPREYSYFFAILFTGLVWATLLVAIFVQTLGLDVYAARILAAVFTGLWSFYLNARFNFRAHAFLRR